MGLHSSLHLTLPSCSGIGAGWCCLWVISFLVDKKSVFSFPTSANLCGSPRLCCVLSSSSSLVLVSCTGKQKEPSFRIRTQTGLKCCCLNFKMLFSMTWLCDLPLFIINLIPQVTVQWIHILFEIFVWSSLKLFKKQLQRTRWELLIYNLQHHSTTSFSFG